MRLPTPSTVFPAARFLFRRRQSRAPHSCAAPVQRPAAASVALSSSLVCELLLTCHTRRQLLALRLRPGALRRPHPRPEQRQHVRIERIGLGQQTCSISSMRAGQVAHPFRIHAHHRQPGSGQCRDDRASKPPVASSAPLPEGGREPTSAPVAPMAPARGRTETVRLCSLPPTRRRRSNL